MVTPVVNTTSDDTTEFLDNSQGHGYIKTTGVQCVVIFTISVNFIIIVFETQAENPKCIKLNDAVVNIVNKETVTIFFHYTFHQLMYKILLSITENIMFC